MKKIIFLIVLVSFAFTGFCQSVNDTDSKTKKQLQKEERAAARENDRMRAFELTKSMVENQRFVLEANRISGRTGQIIQVNSTLNFLIVDTSHIVIQLASHGGMGANGVGGVTTEGSIKNYKFVKDKKGYNYTVSFFASTVLGTFDIVLFVNGDGTANADVNQTTTGSVVRYYGEIVPVELSRIYKGRSI